MPISSIRILNVLLTRKLCSSSRALQALAQLAATEPANITSPLTPRPVKFRRTNPATMNTDILPVDASKLGKITFKEDPDALVDEWSIQYEPGKDVESLRRAAEELATTDIPVAFPTETVYGLGADATRSSAVRAIFAAKGRPADNPLIVHIHSIPQLSALLVGTKNNPADAPDPIPDIYNPLIQRFWPGPLTIILPNPEHSALAPEVTAGLSTFGARMPRSILALALIRLAGVPLAAPSANASTRPSPTAAEHVHDDLNGRIHTILDGGPCEVGVESTVVDGLAHPPAILRPGGVTLEQLRQCPGWEHVAVGYKDAAHEKELQPRAPGMKYRHYSPKATVILYESSANLPDLQDALAQANTHRSIGIIRTKSWPPALGLPVEHSDPTPLPPPPQHLTNPSPSSPPPSLANLLRSITQHQPPPATHFTTRIHSADIWDIHLSADTAAVARGLFSALRELDKKGVGVIYVEGIDDRTGDDIAVAVMNRLRKAAEMCV